MRRWRDSPQAAPDDIPVGRDALDPVVAVCADAAAARDVVQRLASAGCSSARLSVVGKGRQGHGFAQDDAGIADRLRRWGGMGGAFGGIGGLLLGPVLFFVAPVGLMVVGGPFALTLLATLEGALVGAGASAIMAALTSIGVDDEQARRYEQAIGGDGFLVIVHGEAPEIERARRLLGAGKGPAGAAGPPARMP
jgi:hypothetical protein